MIEIKIGDQFLDLPEDISVTFEKSNPLFDDDYFKGSYTLPFSVITTPANQKVFGHQNILEVERSDGAEYAAEISIDGNLYWSGVLVIRTAQRNSYECYFKSGVSVVSTDFKEKTLDELNLGSHALVRDETSITFEVTGYTTGDLRVFHNVSNVDYTFDTDINTTLNNIRTDLLNPASFWNTTEDFLGSFSDVVVVGDTIKFVHILDYVQDGLTTEIDIDEWSSDSAITVSDQNNYSKGKVMAAHMEDTLDPDNGYNHVFFPVKNSEYTSGATYPGYVNYYDGEFKRNDIFSRYAIDDPGKFLITPFVYLHYLVGKVLSLEGFSIDEFFTNNPELKNLVIFNNKTLDKLLRWAEDKYSNIWSYEIQYNQHVPSVTSADVLKSLLGFCTLLVFDKESGLVRIKLKKTVLSSDKYIEFNQKSDYKIDISKDKSVKLMFKKNSSDGSLSGLKSIDKFTVNASVNDFADLPASGDDLESLRLVRNENRYYQFTEYYSGTGNEPEKEWLEFGENLYEYTIDNGKNKIEIPFSLTTMYNGADEEDGARDWLVPQFGVEGKSDRYPVNGDVSGISLLYYHGMVEDSNADEYPFASNYVYGYDQTKISGSDNALILDGDYGLYEKYWKEWVAFIMSSDVVTTTKTLDIVEINQIEDDVWIRENGNEYLYEKYTFTATNDYISPVELTLRKK